MKRTALIAGITGIGGSDVAGELLANGWDVVGLSGRCFRKICRSVHDVVADLLDPAALGAALEDVDADRRFHHHLDAPGHGSGEYPRQRGAGAEPARRAVIKEERASCRARYGLKHYLCPFEAYANSGTPPSTPLRESQPRLPVENFYYAQEEEVYAAAHATASPGPYTAAYRHRLRSRQRHQPWHDFAVYATICKETGRLFQFPGSAAQWNGLSDVTDAAHARQQFVWAADTDEPPNEAFNIVNGDIFRWSWLWPKLAAWLAWSGRVSAGRQRLEAAMADIMHPRREIAATPRSFRARPQPPGLGLAHRPRPGPATEVMTDMENSGRIGFTATRPLTPHSSIFRAPAHASD